MQVPGVQLLGNGGNRTIVSVPDPNQPQHVRIALGLGPRLAVYIGNARNQTSSPFKVSIHTWFWSAVFHSRDLYWTERLDYFSAASMIISALLFQFVR